MKNCAGNIPSQSQPEDLKKYNKAASISTAYDYDLTQRDMSV